MNTSEITGILSSLSCFVGVYAADRLPSQPKISSCLVANTDPHDKPGQHWVAIFIDHNGNGEYFDSYGKPPLPILEKHLPNDYIYNKKRLQGTFTAVCGQYCIFYLINRSKGHTLQAIVNRFASNFTENDALVKRFVDKNFKKTTNMYDFSQICTCEK